MLRFFGDTLFIMYLLLMAVISLGLNTVTTTLTVLVRVIEAYAMMYSALLGAYGSRISAVLKGPQA